MTTTSLWPQTRCSLPRRNSILPLSIRGDCAPQHGRCRRSLVAEDLRCGRLLPKLTPRSPRLSGIVFFLTLASMPAAVHAAENPRKITVVSFGLFGDQGVFRREATGAAQIVANRFGGDPVVVKYNTKT